MAAPFLAAFGRTAMGGVSSLLRSMGRGGYRRLPSRRGALSRDLGKLRMRASLAMDPAGFARSIQAIGEDAMEMLAADTREKIINAIMGNRKNPFNVFPKNKINLKTGQYYKNSIARKYPQPPRPYTRPGDPIALQQAIYRKTPDTRSKISIDGKKITVSEYLVGPMANRGVTSRGTPGLLEKGGTTSSYYRFVPTPTGGFREEFTKKPGKRVFKTPLPKIKASRPVKYATWAEVSAAAAKNQQSAKLRATVASATTLSPDWKGPKSFNVRGRHTSKKSWDKVKPRANRFLGLAKNKFPRFFAQNVRLRRVNLPAVQGAKKP